MTIDSFNAHNSISPSALHLCDIGQPRFFLCDACRKFNPRSPGLCMRTPPKPTTQLYEFRKTGIFSLFALSSHFQTSLEICSALHKIMWEISPFISSWCMCGTIILGIWKKFGWGLSYLCKMFKTLWFKTGVKSLWIYIDLYATDVHYLHIKIRERIWKILQILKEEWSP